ncbi:MAG: translation initiation factor IF-2 [Bacteroidales bacterium]|nr:translation initiation factor IF-2 [Bacteroidales bacterium]
MTEESTQVRRLGKVARELNIGMHTIVDFLTKKGHKVDNNPNAKIDEKIYDILLAEFQSEKSVKEKSKLISIGTAKKETITIDDNKVKEPSVSNETETKDYLIKSNQQTSAKEESKTETVTKAKEKKEKPKEVSGPDTKTDEINIKIVGKVELKKEKEKQKEKKETKEKEKKSGRKKKGEKETPVEETAQAPEAAAEIEDKVTVTATSAEVETEVTELEEKEDIFYKTEFKKLEGPTILGKIDLPPEKTEEQKKAAASSPGGAFDPSKRKKRKRIKKEWKKKEVDVSGTQERRDKHHKEGTHHYKDKRKKQIVRVEPTAEEIQKQIKETLAKLSGTGKSKASKYRRIKREEVSQKNIEEQEKQEIEKKTIKVTEFVTANELATMMNVPVTEIISNCMHLGMFVSINQRLDAETLTIVAEEFGYKVEFVSVEVQESIKTEEDKEEDLVSRAPIVTVMGHVDHGKTSLLDYIRKANVIAGEAGGITQHIGAYEVTLENGKKITFLDTPGHEAFTAMRARGAKVTDVVILVVAADDSVMPQTIEAINHAQAANVPIVIAINKIDKPNANIDKIKQELSNVNILVEDWGGKYQFQEISAKKGTNIDSLLVKVLLEAEMLDLKANPKKMAVGTIIESTLDKGRGYVATILVDSGTLKIGDIVLAGYHFGRVKAMFNERNQRVETAGPSTPVLILGLDGAPQAGDRFNVMEDEKETKNIAYKRLQLQREQGIRTQKHITLDEIGRRIAIGDFKELNIIVKGDVDGSIEAISDSLLKLSTPKIQVNVIHKSVGQVTESDVLLASASDAIIIAFQVRPSLNARKLAEQEQIDIRNYSIIYDAIEEVRAAMEGMLSPEIQEKITCNIEIREVFNITKIGNVAGCYVLDGKVTRNTKIRLIRNGIVVHTGTLASLKRFKDDVKEVLSGYECGLNISNFEDIKAGDIIEGYEEIEVKAKL